MISLACFSSGIADTSKADAAVTLMDLISSPRVGSRAPPRTPVKQPHQLVAGDEAWASVLPFSLEFLGIQWELHSRHRHANHNLVLDQLITEILVIRHLKRRVTSRARRDNGDYDVQLLQHCVELR